MRAAAMVDELNKAVEEYEAALAEFEIFRQRYEAAKEKFIGVRRLAADVMPASDMYDWEHEHPDIQMVGLDIKDAILTILRRHAVDSADTAITSKDKTEYNPTMFTTSIYDALDRYGFAFRTGTPRREVHAALLHLKGVTKVGTMRYAIEDADDIYKNMVEAYGGHVEEQKPPAEEEKAKGLLTRAFSADVKDEPDDDTP